MFQEKLVHVALEVRLHLLGDLSQQERGLHEDVGVSRVHQAPQCDERLPTHPLALVPGAQVGGHSGPLQQLRQLVEVLAHVLDVVEGDAQLRETETVCVSVGERVEGWCVCVGKREGARVKRKTLQFLRKKRERKKNSHWHTHSVGDIKLAVILVVVTVSLQDGMNFFCVHPGSITDELHIYTECS